MPPRLGAALLAAITLAALTVAGTPLRAALAQPDPPVTCQEVRDLGLIVSLSDRDLTAGDETRFCLVARPEEDTFTGYLANVSTADEFRAAKQTFADAMLSAGFDPCRVGVWRPLNREGGPQLTLSAADRLDIAVACPPHVVARDPGAAARVGMVTAALGTLAERSAADFGLTPRRALSVDLYSDAAAMADALRAARPELDGQAAAQIARQGRSLTVLSPTRGTYMILNLTDAPQPDTLLRRLAHEYTHFVQASTGGTLDAYPVWFLEGQAEFQLERIAGADWDRRADAARRERNGGAPRLPDLVTADGWAAAEARMGNGVYSRGYSAVAFLVERWGYAASVRLLRAGSDTDPARFDRTLAEITGLDLAGFDQALGDWLRTLGGRVTFTNDSPLAIRLVLPGGSVDIPACATCAFHGATDTCREDGRPSVKLDLQPGDQRILRVIPDDRIHYPDTMILLQIEPGANLSRCLELRV